MKRGINFLFGSLFLFNQAVSQVNFSKDAEVKVVYNNEVYIVEQYRPESKEHAYKIHLMNGSTLKKGDLIGDSKDEFHTYQDVALASNLSLDKWNEILHLEKIRSKFLETNDYYKANRIINPVLEEVIKFAKEIYPEKDFNQKNLSEKLEKKYGEEIKAKTLEIISKLREANKDGKLKNDHDIKELINDIFFDPSVNEIIGITEKISDLKSRLKKANEKVINSYEMFSIRNEMYGLLRRGYSINAMQEGYIKATGDLLSRMENVGTILFADDAEMNKLIERTNKEIKRNVAKTLSLFDKLIKIEEEKFNPENEKSLASKFLKWVKEHEANNFSLEDLTIESTFPNQVSPTPKRDSFGLEVKRRNITLENFKDTGPNEIKITMPWDFKELNNAIVSFDIMPLVDHLIDYYVIVGCEGEKGYYKKSILIKNGENKTRWKIIFDKKNSNVVFEENKEGKSHSRATFDVKNSSCLKIRIMPVTYYNTRENREEDINLQISNLEIKTN